MPDYLGLVPVPEVSPSGTFPFTPEWPFYTLLDPEVVVHTFGAGNAKREQRYWLGHGPRRWRLDLTVTHAQWNTLREFWEDHQGPVIPFTFEALNADQTTTSYTAQFESEPLIVQRGRQRHAVSVALREVFTGSGPVYSVSATQTRFPNGALASALAAQAQTLIPLLKITPRQAGYPAIYLSDRRCTVGGQLYLPRLLELPEIRQSAVGVPGASAETDDATFVLGNADGVIRDLATHADYGVMLDFARVEYSLFHVGTGIKLDLWGGEIAREGWQIDGPTAYLRCTDRLANPFLIFPNRTIDRGCTAPFDVAPLCPYSSAGGLDTAHFPSASGTSCDHGYATPNGCLAHGMERYYRGVPVTPQPFRSKDNSTGLRGLGRAVFTSLSQVSDGIMGRPLPYIFTAEDLPVKALLATGADQGDFYEAVGIIGQGPLGALGDPMKHKLDGQPQHDPKFPPRAVLGAEPAGPNDYLSLSYNGNQVNGDWRKAYVGNSTYIRNLSAGLAFLTIRRTDEKGQQFTRLDEHEMEVIVREGLSGWKWTAPGSRSSVLLTNPVWVAVNLLLWALNLHTETAAVQESYFDVAAAIAAAAICDETVTKIVGSGSETQFTYAGVISEQRPLREWIEDVLKNCLGYYVNSAGKLRIGIRSNSSAVAAFTSGNLLHRSVRFDPPKRGFNRLVVSFADRLKDEITGETLYLPNTATAFDEDFALELGGGTRAEYFEGQTNLAGTNNVSQAQRIANVRLREETGGVSAAERLQHGRVRGSTTVLGLDFSAGDVISVADPEIPGGTAEIRVTTWRLGPDFRVDFEGYTTRDSMYDLLEGPKPADVLPDGVPPEEEPWPFRLQWQPNAETPVSGDPVHAAGHNTFALQQRYEPLYDGSQRALLDVTGVQPVTRFVADTYAPVIRTVTQASTGGHLPGERRYWISVCAWNSDGFSPPCRLRVQTTAEGTDTNRFTLADITWPAGSWSGYAVFVGIDDERTATQQAKVTGALPSSIAINGPLQVSTVGVPSPTTRRVVAFAKKCIHFGLWGEVVTGVAAGAVTVAAIAGLSDDYTGRILAVVADQSDGSANLLHFTVTGHNLTTGELSLTPDPQAAGVEFGDVATILLQPNIYAGATIGDAMIANGIYPDGLGTEDPEREAGLLIRGITPGRPHQLRRIVSHTATAYTVDEPFDFEPLYFIVEEAGWPYRANSSDIANRRPDAEITTTLVVDNLVGQPMLVGAFLEDRRGLLTPEEMAPVRFTYLYGQPGSAIAIDDGFYDAPIVGDEVEIDLANGLNQRITLDQASRVTIKNPVNSAGPIRAGMWLQLYILQDDTGERPNPEWDSGYGQIDQISPDADTRTSIGLTYDGAKWRLDYFQTGLPL